MGAVKTEDPVVAAGKMAGALRRRFASALFCRGFLAASGIAGFAAGGVILAGRLVDGDWPFAASAAAVLAGLFAALLCGGIHAWKHVPERRKLLVWLDGAGRSGGLLASSLETDDGEWRTRISLPAGVRVRVSAGRYWLPAAAGALFLAGALLFPASGIAGRDRHALDISEETALLEQKLEVLEEESLMPEKELAGLRADLKELEENNRADESARTYELLDALSRRVELAGEEAGRQAAENRETLQMLSMALDSLSLLPLDQLPPEAAGEMGGLLRKLSEENPELAELLKQSGAAAQLDPATMKRLAEAMRDSSGRLEKQLAKLVESKLMKSRCAKPGNCSGPGGECGSPGACLPEEDLAEWLARNAPGADGLGAVVMMCMANGDAPGAGGISRGRADAALTFTGSTPDHQGRPVDLALAGETDPAQSMVVQRFAAAPQADEAEQRAAAAGSLRGGGAAVDRREMRVYPEHRSAVERYFKPKEGR